MNNRLVLLMGIISLGLGFLVGSSTDTGLPSGKLIGDFDINYSQEGSTENGVYSLPYANQSHMLGGEGSDVPLFHWETNSKGLREDPFSKDKPKNTTRILVVGDSITLGWGVNESKRFTDRLEKELNQSTKRNIQVINSGVPAWGMKDYFLFMKNKGINYDPDIVVVAFSYPQDAFNREKGVEFYKKANASVNESRRYYKVGQIESSKKERVQRKVSELRREFYDNLTFESSNVSDYMGRILELNRENNVETVFFGYEKIWEEKKKVKDWMEKNNARVLWSPELLNRENPESEQYRFEKDPHYNPKGNKVLAEKLHEYFHNSDLVGNS